MSKITDQPMTDLANAAFEEAAKEVVKRAIETGTPVIVWRNGSVLKLDPHQLIATTQKKLAE